MNFSDKFLCEVKNVNEAVLDLADKSINRTKSLNEIARHISKEKWDYIEKKERELRNSSGEKIGNQLFYLASFL